MTCPLVESTCHMVSNRNSQQLHLINNKVYKLRYLNLNIVWSRTISMWDSQHRLPHIVSPALFPFSHTITYFILPLVHSNTPIESARMLQNWVNQHMFGHYQGTNVNGFELLPSNVLCTDVIIFIQYWDDFLFTFSKCNFACPQKQGGTMWYIYHIQNTRYITCEIQCGTVAYATVQKADQEGGGCESCILQCRQYTGELRQRDIHEGCATPFNHYMQRSPLDSQLGVADII